MGLGDKTEHVAEEFAGKAKRVAGKALGDEKLEARGTVEEGMGKAKRAVDDVVEAGKEAVDRPDERE